jgi:RNA polymerase sigma-70 factor (ECF subfamily)
MSGQVLYVEDEEDYQMLVHRILSKTGLQVHVSPTGSAALSALERVKPRLIILDINLPDTDGYTLCSQLRQDPTWRNIPILMLTVRRRPEEWLKGFSCGADDYVPKPLNPPDLIDRVTSCLHKSHEPVRDALGAEYLLVQAAVTGNRSAFEVLIRKYRERLVDNLCAMGRSAADAEDLVSISYVSAFEKLAQFRGQASFYTWLFRIAMNEAHHQCRKSQGISIEEITHGDESALPESLAEPDINNQKINTHMQHQQLHHAVSCVPKPYKQMLKWHFMDGMSYQAMARRLKIPTGTVMSRLFKARHLLRKAWQSHQAVSPPLARLAKGG